MTSKLSQPDDCYDLEAIPFGWSSSSLGDLGKCIRGVSYKPDHLRKENGAGSVTLLRSNNIRDERINFDDVQHVVGSNISDEQYIQRNDIALCMSNGSKALVGKSAVVKSQQISHDSKLTVGAFCAIYRSRFVYTAHIVKSSFFQKAIDLKLSGSAINNLKCSDVESVKFPLPPLTEQLKITSILNVVDEKIDVVNCKITTTNDLKKGLMQFLFNQGFGSQSMNFDWAPHKIYKSSSLGKIPENWDVKKIGDVLDVIERPTVMVDNQTYRRVTVKRRHGGVILRDELLGLDIKVKSQFSLKEGDFLISERQIVHGACGIVPVHLDGALVSNEYLVLQAKEGFDMVFLLYLVQVQKYAKLFLMCSQGVDIEKFLFKPKDWLEKQIPVPPLEEQKKIADVLAAIEKKTNILKNQLSGYKILKRGLMQKLLTGEWRVKIDDPTPATEQ